MLVNTLTYCISDSVLSFNTLISHQRCGAPSSLVVDKRMCPFFYVPYSVYQRRHIFRPSPRGTCRCAACCASARYSGWRTTTARPAAPRCPNQCPGMRCPLAAGSATPTPAIRSPRLPATAPAGQRPPLGRRSPAAPPGSPSTRCPASSASALTAIFLSLG